MRLSVCPLDLDEANALVRSWHRHHAPVVGHKFSLGAVHGGEFVGAIIVGRPAEKTRSCQEYQQTEQEYHDSTPTPDTHP